MDAPIKKKAEETDILSFDYGLCTHIGKRQHNQDEVLVPSAPGTLIGYGKLFAVADGMGGHPGGGIASRIACDRLSDFYERSILREGRQKPADISRGLVEDMIFEGEVDPAQAQSHPLRHMLTSAVGTGEPLEWVDTRIDGLKSRDCFFLCTDGLYNAIAEIDILHSLAERSIAADTAGELVARAVKNGARDNITAVVVKI